MASITESREQASEPVAAPQWLMDAALTRMHQGALPRELFSRVLAGPGRKQVCSLCDYPIEPGDVGYEVRPENNNRPDTPLNFHVCCYRAWAQACNAMPRAYRRTAAPTAPFPDPKRSVT